MCLHVEYIHLYVNIVHISNISNSLGFLILAVFFINSLPIYASYNLFQMCVDFI